MSDAQKLTPDDLLAWGRGWERSFKEPGKGFSLGHLHVLEQYVQTANDALASMQRAQTKRRTSSGRPPGEGMGEQVMRLVANGINRDNAFDMVMKAKRGRTIEGVRRAYDRARKKSTG